MSPDNLLPEHPDERRQFDDVTNNLYDGDAFQQVIAVLSIYSKVHPNGSLAAHYAIMANECRKIHAELEELRKTLYEALETRKYAENVLETWVTWVHPYPKKS